MICILFFFFFFFFFLVCGFVCEKKDRKKQKQKIKNYVIDFDVPGFPTKKTGTLFKIHTIDTNKFSFKVVLRATSSSISNFLQKFSCFLWLENDKFYTHINLFIESLFS